MQALCQAVVGTGKKIREMQADCITDTIRLSGHQFSTLDDNGKLILRREVEIHLGDMLKGFMEESDIQINVSDSVSGYPVAIGDAVEGSTNAKRGLSSSLARHTRRPINAGTSLMVLDGKKMSNIVATAFYDWSSDDVFSSVRTEPGSFNAFINGKILWPKDATTPPHDSQLYAIVPGYSHTNVGDRAEAEERLLANGIRTDGGTRSSAQDLLQLLCGQVDFYVDLRQLFTQRSSENRDEVLRAWDVGALLPVLDALGFKITNENTQSWQEKCFGDSLTLVIARNDSLWQKIRETIATLSFVKETSPEPNIVRLAQ